MLSTMCTSENTLVELYYNGMRFIKSYNPFYDFTGNKLKGTKNMVNLYQYYDVDNSCQRGFLSAYTTEPIIRVARRARPIIV